jgi:polyphosphate glucokinase
MPSVPRSDASAGPPRRVLTVDVGGSHVKVLASDVSEPRKFDSGPELTPDDMVKQVKELTRDWSYDAVSIGYPGPVARNRVAVEPKNLATGWVGFDFQQAFGAPVKLINDAAMQALGIYDGGHMLFLGLGTGLGSALVFDGTVIPLEVAHLPYRKGRTYEEYVGLAGFERLGKRKWRQHVWAVVALLRNALQPEYVVVGGGNAKLLRELPEGVRLGANASAFVGGFRLWDEPRGREPASVSAPTGANGEVTAEQRAVVTDESVP